MSDNLINKKQIAKNTILLYIRQIFVLFTSLYTVRIVFNALGVTDYGVFNVVAGVVTLLSFLNGTMSTATQRFFSFALGKKDERELEKTFSVNIFVYLGIALVAIIILESIGLWFVNNHLLIPLNRIDAVNLVFQCSIFVFVLSVLTTPFNAIIIAHEDMGIFAYLTILDVLLKLVLVYSLTVLPFDKLKAYSVLVLLSTTITSFTTIIIAFRKYSECQFKKFYWDNALFKEILSFTGWTLFGQVSTVGRFQAITILLNQFFNPAVVASRAIANNVAGNVSSFANNFNTGIYPPIIKAYAANDKNGMFSLIYSGSKISFYLMWFFSLPLFVELDMVLSLWLVNPPIEAIMFSRLSLIEIVIMTISMPIATAARAPGKMKLYELTLGTIQLGIFLGAWVFLVLGFGPNSVFYISIFANVVMYFIRLVIVKKLIGLSIFTFNVNVLLPIMKVSIVTIALSFIVNLIIPNGLIYSLINVLTNVMICLVVIYFVGIDSAERQKLNNFLSHRIKKVFPK